MSKIVYEPVPEDDAIEQIAIGVHTGLRKGSEAPTSALIWREISNSEDSAWADAVRFCIHGMETMGYVLCKRVVVRG